MPPEPASLRLPSVRVDGLRWAIPKTDRLLIASGASVTKSVILDHIRQRRGSRDYMLNKPYARLAGRLAPLSKADAQKVPPFNPFKLYANPDPLDAGDLRDPEICHRACQGVETVYHQGALPSVPRSIADPITSNAVNVDGTLHMLMAARDAGDRAGAVKFIMQTGAASAGSNELRVRQQDLQRAIDNNSSEQEIKQKLASLREARQRAREELAKARRELTDLLTQRQEAILYQRGILD